MTSVERWIILKKKGEKEKEKRRDPVRRIAKRMQLQVNKMVPLIKGDRAWNSFRWISSAIGQYFSYICWANEREQPGKWFSLPPRMGKRKWRTKREREEDRKWTKTKVIVFSLSSAWKRLSHDCFYRLTGCFCLMADHTFSASLPPSSVWLMAACYYFSNVALPRLSLNKLLSFHNDSHGS